MSLGLAMSTTGRPTLLNIEEQELAAGGRKGLELYTNGCHSEQ